MNEDNITRRSTSALGKGKTDHDRLRRLTDSEIADAVDQDEDAARLDIDWSKAEVVVADGKQAISIRLDRDVIEFFKKMSPRYQTRINAVLRSYMRHENHNKG